MLEPAATKIGMPMEEFIRLYDTEGPFELIDGERKPIMPQVAGHGIVVQDMWRALHEYAERQRLGEAWMRMPFVRIDGHGHVTHSLTPDLMFCRAEKLAAYKVANPDWKDKPYVLIPDLVIEVVSHYDDLGELDEKN